MPNDIAIRIENLTKIYKLYDSPQDRLKESLHPLRKKYHRDFYALNDVNFEITKGETAGIIGKNGSGKSTLLKIITGVLTPTSGAVAVNGKISALLELGAGFNPELTGIENIYFNGTLMGYTKGEMDEKLDEILSFADIGDFVYQPIKSYSSGMLVRLAFGVAINVDPDILIVDEALAVGDIKFQRKCFTKIEQFQNRNKTILFVSHSSETVHLLCNKAILLHDGHLLTSGVPKKVTKIYQKMMLGQNFESDVALKALQNDIGFDTEPTSPSPHLGNRVIDSERLARDLNKLKETALLKLASTGYEKTLEIIDYAILDAKGSRVHVLESGNNYSFVVRLLIHSTMEDIIVGYQIKNLKGLLIFGVNNRLQKMPIREQTRGNILEISLGTTLYLATGDYFLSLRTGTADNLIDEMSDIIHFKVHSDCDLISDSIVNLNPVMSVNNIM